MPTEKLQATAGQSHRYLTERMGRGIPDPVVIFLALFIFFVLASHSLSGVTFSATDTSGALVTHSIRNMVSYDGVRWMFEHALLDNWLGYGNGMLGTITAVLLGVGIAQESGLLTALIKSLGMRLTRSSRKVSLPFAVMLLGTMSSVVSEIGYVMFIPLAGFLYGSLNRNPIIGMATAFAGVSAGFGAHLLPATPVDVILGVHAQAFAEAQQVPFPADVSPATMHYWFLCLSTFAITLSGGLVTVLVVEPRWRKRSWQQEGAPNIQNFTLTDQERYGLRWGLAGLMIALSIVAWLIFGPLAVFYDADGAKVTPWMDHIVLLVALIFSLCGLLFGAGAGTFGTADDVVKAITRQSGFLGYTFLLTFFCYNFLSLLSYTGIDIWITWLGASAVKVMGVQSSPVVLLLGFVATSAVISLFIGGLTAKWLLFGPVFIPLLYQTHNSMTPDVVTAAFRIADASANMVSPMMVCGGVVLSFMRRYRPNLSPGDLIGIMLPYSVVFLVVWSALLVVFFQFGWALGV